MTKKDAPTTGLALSIPTQEWRCKGLMSKEYLDNPDSLVSHAIHYAHALVEKMKEKEEK